MPLRSDHDEVVLGDHIDGETAVVRVGRRFTEERQIRFAARQAAHEGRMVGVS